MTKKIIEIKERIKGYEENFLLSEINTPFILIAEVLTEIATRLEEITNKMYE